MTTALVILFMVFGLAAAFHPVFLMTEFFVNAIILVDFVCRVKIQGARKYFSNFLNVFDFIVIFGCFAMFLLLLVRKIHCGLLSPLASSLDVKVFEEVTEEVLFVVWAVWQYLRLFMFIKKQQVAFQNAKTLIDLTSAIETEKDANGDERIVIDMRKMEQKQRRATQMMNESNIIINGRSATTTKKKVIQHGDNACQNLEGSSGNCSVQEIEMVEMNSSQVLKGAEDGLESEGEENDGKDDARSERSDVHSEALDREE